MHNNEGVFIMPISDSQNKANKKYKSKTYKQITLLIRNEDYAELETFLLDKNESKNGFIKRAIKEQIKRDINEDQGRKT